MADTKYREAAQVLTRVAEEYKAAKDLSEALKVAADLEGALAEKYKILESMDASIAKRKQLALDAEADLEKRREAIKEQTVKAQEEYKAKLAQFKGEYVAEAALLDDTIKSLRAQAVEAKVQLEEAQRSAKAEKADLEAKLEVLRASVEAFKKAAGGLSL